MTAQTPIFSIFAPAKVNLHLAVLDRRPDGFHNIESLFYAVNFGDILHFYPLEKENACELTVYGGGLDLPAEKNLIYKAQSLFREKTGFNQGLRIEVEKRTPVGGGLGGGSSDAAATLLALNSMAGSLLAQDELLETAACLGSDVPFFIYRAAAAHVTGRGEVVLPLEVPPMSLVLVNPGFVSNTAAAFRLLDEHRAKDPSRSSAEAQSLQSREFSPRFPRLCVRNFKKYFNDFLPVFPEPEKSVYNSIISQLKEQGADYAGLSGAGSTCFGVFKKKAIAEKAAASLRSIWNFVESCSLYNAASFTNYIS